MQTGEVRYIHDGEWALVGLGGASSLAVYPREERKPVTYSIGQMAPSGEWYDLIDQTGFENMDAAIDQAIWLTETPDILRRVSTW